MASRSEETNNVISYLMYSREKLASIQWELSSETYIRQASSHINSAIRALRLLGISLEISTDIPEYGAAAAELNKTLEQLA